jgi:hypothetical protein
MAIDVKVRPGLMISERDFQSRVVDYALYCGWRYCHYRAVQSSKRWAVPVEGHVGCPDLILARHGLVLLVELKAERGRATPGQRLWLAAAGVNGFLWKPSDWSEILDVLR